jgi:hypothetical protein
MIKPEMTVLDIVSTFESTVDVFKKWDDRAGECICCNALFEPLNVVAKNYNLEIKELLTDLNNSLKQ